MTAAVAALGVLIASAGAEAVAIAAPTAPAKPCATAWRAVERAAVRRPGPYDEPAATMRTPIRHHLRKGEVVRSCTSRWRALPTAHLPTGPAAAGEPPACP